MNAGGGSRTLTLQGARDFESRASTNSATPATCFMVIREIFSPVNNLNSS